MAESYWRVGGPGWRPRSGRRAHGARRRAGRARARRYQPQSRRSGRVLLDAGLDVVGEGFHATAGGPHAEVVALRAGGRAGPGRHRLRDALAALRPHRPHRPVQPGAAHRRRRPRGDRRRPTPTPEAAGGAARLRARGVAVETGLLAEEAERVNAEWLTFARLRRPHVTWKFAATLDGRSAAADGTSRWITSAEARARRPPACAPGATPSWPASAPCSPRPRPDGPPRAADALARTPPRAGDALACRHRPRSGRHPRLTARAPAPSRAADPARRGRLRPPARRPPPGCWTGPPPRWSRSPTALVTGPRADLLRLPRHDDGLDLRRLLAELAARDVVSVFLEGGPHPGRLLPPAGPRRPRRRLRRPGAPRLRRRGPRRRRRAHHRRRPPLRL